MKKISICILLCILCVALAACQPQQNSLSVTDGVVSWNEISNATEYNVEINGKGYVCKKTSFVIPSDVFGEVTIKVFAKTGKKTVPVAETTATVTQTLSKPYDLKLDGDMLSWRAVQNADKYFVVLNDVSYETANTQISLKYVVSGSVSVVVYAVSDNPYLQNSPRSEATVEVTEYPLQTVENVRVEGGRLTFDKVEGAKQYQIYVDGAKVATTDDNTVALTPEMIGETLKVRAVSDVAIPSPLSQAATLSFGEIENEAQLTEINAGYFSLKNDIALTTEYTPKAFGGVFRGNNHTISGIDIAYDASVVGFFAELTKATVSDLTLRGKIELQSATSGPDVGGLCGKAQNSIIENCFVFVDITAEFRNGLANVGGIVGSLINTDVLQTEYQGTITTRNAVCGGFVGTASNPTENRNVKQCKTKATIKADGGERAFAGGFIGKFTDNMLTVSQCVADVDVTGQSYVGGFVGYFGSGKVLDSITLGQVSAQNPFIVHLGGFIGRAEGYNVTAERCISASSVQTTVVAETKCVGGFVGKTVGGTYAYLYKDCFFDSEVNAIQAVGNPDSGRSDGITGVTTRQLETPSTFSTFDSSVWNIADGEIPMPNRNRQ